MKLVCCLLIAVGLFGCAKSDSRDPSGVKITRISDTEYKELLATDSDLLVEKAQVGRLGVCSALNVGHQYVDGCRDNDTWVVYLQDPGAYFPSMEKSAQKDDYACKIWIGGKLRKALEDGFCFFNSIGPVK